MRMFSITLCSYQDILHIPTSFQQFSTSLGPIVDGHVIPNQPYKVMGHYTEHFSRFVKQLLSQFSHPSILALDPAGPCPRRPAEYTHYWPDYLFIVRYLIRCLAFGIRLPLVKSNRPWNPSMHFVDWPGEWLPECHLLESDWQLNNPLKGDASVHVSMLGGLTKVLKIHFREVDRQITNQLTKNEPQIWVHSNDLLELIFGIYKITQQATKIIAAYFKYSFGLRLKLSPLLSDLQSFILAVLYWF